MTGSNPFLLESTDNFERSFRKLIKSYKSKSQQGELVAIISVYLNNIVVNPYPSESRLEPLNGLVIPLNWAFHKLAFSFGKGASGSIRIMYLVNEIEGIIKPLWIYTHDEFVKRPSQKDLKSVFKESFQKNDSISNDSL